MKRLAITGVRDLTFGRHSSRSFDGFDAPFVVVHGPNESGKSTLAEFLLWAIGGPFRAYADNSDAFRRGVDGAVGGRLLGVFDGQSLDIDAQFKLLNSGTPNDNRRGAIGAAEVDAAKLAERFGSLAASEYELIYRLYGASLGDVGSAKLFSDVFTRFALGSESASTSPRRILDGISARSKKSTERLKKLTSERNKVKAEIKDASRAPEEIDKLTAEIESLNEQITHVEAVATAAAARVALHERVRDGLGHLDALREAQGIFAGHETVSPEWEALAANQHRLSELVADVTELQRLLEGVERRATSSVGACGIPEATLEGRTVTPAERTELSTAVGAAMEARRVLSSAQTDLGPATAAFDEAVADELRRTEALGLNEGHLSHLDEIAETIPALSARASRWVEAINDAIGFEAQIKGEQVKVGSPAAGPRGSAPETSVSPWMVVVLLAAVGLLGAINRVAGIVTAIVAAGGYLLYSSRRRSRSGLPGVANQEADHALTDAAARAAEEREKARLHRAELDQALGVLSTVISEPDTATVRLAQLSELARARAVTAESRGRVDLAHGRIESAAPGVSKTERAALELFASRGIPPEVLTDGFDQWLAKYETAVNDVTEAGLLRGRLASARAQLDDIVAPVADEIGGLSPADIESRLTSVSAVLRSRREAEAKVREAEVRVVAANMDSSEIADILAGHKTAAELQVVIDASRSDVQAAQHQRDDLVERRLTATTTLNAKLGTEVLPGLHLELGRIQEEIEEAEQESAALGLAVSVLAEVIDGYERDNQDPVVSSASMLISQVVPDWGAILMSRTDKGVPVIERVGPDGRLNDSKISDGGRALLYMGIRLAFAQKDTERRGVSLPIICDDPFVHFDDDRTESGVRLLASVASRNQVILMTCQTEVRDFAVSLGASAIEM